MRFLGWFMGDRSQGKGGGVEGVVVWRWRKLRPDLWPGLLVFFEDGYALVACGPIRGDSGKIERAERTVIRGRMTLHVFRGHYAACAWWGDSWRFRKD